MSFQPVIPLSGYAGWRFLQQSLPIQQAAFRADPGQTRAADHFRQNIAAVRTADDLVADRQLLQVALGAFGLDDDLNNRAFIRKVLAEGTLSDSAFANRLSDKRYAALAREFGFGDLGARTGLSFFSDDLLARYEARQFERAVGEANGDLRLALSLRDQLADATNATDNPRAQWFTLMGTPPLRRVFEAALGFPQSFGAIDLDQQLTAFQDRAERTLGTANLAEIAADPALQDKVIRLFLIRAEAAAAAVPSGAAAALALLRQGGG